MKQIRITTKCSLKDTEELNNALLTLLKLGLINSPTINRIVGEPDVQIDFKMNVCKIEYPNEKNNRLIIVE